VEAFTSLAATPLSILLAAGFAVAAVAVPAAELSKGVLPLAFAAVAVLIADVPARERRAGTTSLVFAAPQIKARFVAWKFLAAVLMLVVILAGPLVKIALTAAAPLPALLSGIVVVAAFATALGVLTSNPKAFIVVFLCFWYAVVSSGGQSPALDFAGFFSASTVPVIAGWTLAAAIVLAGAHAFHAATVRR
jgi:ABC-type transport system involved in multi-copper enzyme maturation permease subunit